MIYKTLVLKLHKPTRHKATLIDDAMKRYALALEYILEAMKKEVLKDESKKKVYQIDKGIMEGLNKLQVQPFKDSLKKDAEAILASYAARKRGNNVVHYPQVYLSQEQCNHMLEELVLDYGEYGISQKRFYHQADKILQKMDKMQTLFFCRSGESRDFAILYDSTKKRYYAKMYLLNCANGIQPVNTGKSSLIYVNQKQTPFVAKNKNIRYVIVPLEFGKWHESYLQMVFTGQTVIKTARLTKKNNDYYLYLNMQLNTASQDDYPNYIGLLPTGGNTLKYMVCDQEREEIACGDLAGKGGNWQQITKDLAEQVSDLVKAYQAKVIVYNHKTKSNLPSDLLNWRLSIGDYDVLIGKIYQKMGEAGLPEPIRVTPRGLYTTCPKCGNNTKQNLSSSELFICNRCGYSAQIDRLGVTNLAFRLLDYNKKSLIFQMSKHKDTINIVNSHLGINLNVENNLFYFKKLLNYLTEEKEYGRLVLSGEKHYAGDDYKQKYPLWRKLLTIDNMEEYIVIKNK